MTNRDRRFRADDRGSQAIVALENAWLAIRQIHKDIPAAVLVVVDVSGRKRKWGHFAGWSWKARGKRRVHEVAINPALFGQPEQVLGVLLHEAAHASLHEEGLHGGVSGRYYHLKEFRDRCLQYELDCKFANTRYGWTNTEWPEDRPMPVKYRSIVKRLKAELPFGDEGERVRREGRPLPKSGHIRLFCSCRSIYASPPVAKAGQIICGICETIFQPHTE